MFIAADCKDDGEDAGCNNVSATNSILLSLLTDRLKNIHDIELPLCDHDTAHIVKLLCARNCNNTDYVLPPCVPTRFHCYVRILASSHLVLTLVPAVYEDMVAVMSLLDSLGSADDSVTGLSEVKNVEAATETVDCSRIPADQNIEETSDSLKSNNGQASAEDGTTQGVGVAADDHVAMQHQHRIRLPVFVFDCLLNLVSDQLVHQSSSDRPPDIVEDFTTQVMVVVSDHVNV